MRRGAYLAATLGLVLAACAAAAVGGRGVVAVATGCGIAWAVQAVSFWLLAGGLGRGDRVMRVWVVGMAARVGTGVLVWILARVAGAPTRDLMVSYGLALVVFLLLEAGWLAVATAD